MLLVWIFNGFFTALGVVQNSQECLRLPYSDKEYSWEQNRKRNDEVMACYEELMAYLAGKLVRSEHG